MIASILSTGVLGGNETNKSASEPTELHKMLFDFVVRAGKGQG